LILDWHEFYGRVKPDPETGRKNGKFAFGSLIRVGNTHNHLAIQNLKSKIQNPKFSGLWFHQILQSLNHSGRNDFVSHLDFV
jgi:hypothetical protein